MNSRRILSILFALLVQLLIIFAFLHFGRDLNTKILNLNIFISSVIFGIIYFNEIIPWINLKDESHRTLGSIGLRGIIELVYVTLSITLMITFYFINSLSYHDQLIINVCIFLLYIFGCLKVYAVSEKTNEIYFEEKKNRSGIEEMLKVTKRFESKLSENKELPQIYLQTISSILENIRYLSPSNNDESYALQKDYIEKVNQVNNSLYSKEYDLALLGEKISAIERVFRERKCEYSK